MKGGVQSKSAFVLQPTSLAHLAPGQLHRVDKCTTYANRIASQLSFTGFRLYGFFPSKTTAREGDRGFVSQIQKTLLKRIEKVSWMVVSVKNCGKLRSQHTVKTLSDGCLESFYQMLRQAQAASLATAPCQINANVVQICRSLRLGNVRQNWKFAKLQTVRSVCLWSRQTMLHGKQKGVPRVVRQQWQIICTLPLPFGQDKGACSS